MNKEKLFRLGKSFYDEEKYEEAYYYFLEASMSGDAHAMVYLGLLYLYGEYVDRSYKKAFHYFCESYVASNEEIAMAYISMERDEITKSEEGKREYRDFIDFMIKSHNRRIYIVQAEEYGKGDIYPKSIQNKIACYEEAIRLGENMGAECLGQMYYLGDEVECDYEKSYRYFQNHEGFESFTKPYYLGEMYRKGCYLEQDTDKAIREYRKIVDADWPYKSVDSFYSLAIERLQELQSL